LTHAAPPSLEPRPPGPKRFFQGVFTEVLGTGHVVRLDTHLLKTPGGVPLTLPTAALAGLVASEWAAQGETIEAWTMPVTRLLNVAVEHGEKARAGLVAEVVKYAGTDLVCYRATHPDELVARQKAAWDGPLEWAAQALNAPLTTTAGLMAVEQEQTALDAFGAWAGKLDDITLTIAGDLLSLLGSAVLAAALIERALDEQAAWTAARVDDDFARDRWGEDEEEAARARTRARDLNAACRVLAALRDENP
jgi:chaperone required for assembly of F1-ATPase